MKFEIKSHDGPGRLGKLNKQITPMLFNENEWNIAPSEGSAYNIEKEIAEWNVKKTLELSNNEDIAIIQGSKYVDLRVECALKLQKKGFNGFIIANGDDLLLHPKDLIEIIVSLRENLNPNSYLIFPFSEPSFMPILAYIGIDGFLYGIDEYYSYLNVLMTPTKNYDLKQYPIYNMNQKEIANYNKNTLEFVIKEIQTHMKNKSLRNLIEERSLTSPQNISILKILDRHYNNYILKNHQLY